MSEKQPQFNQINEQISKGSVIPATVLVERSDGSIDTGHAFHDNHHIVAGATSTEKATVFLSPDSEGYAATKTVSTEKLSDEYQQKLARELGGKALKDDSEDIVNAMRFDRMFEDTDSNGKPEDVAARPEESKEDLEIVNTRRAMNDALAEKARAQKEGRGEDSIYWGQVAGQYSRELNK